MATEVPQYSDAIYKRLRGLRRDVPEYTEVDYKKSVPISNRVCAGIKVHYSNIPVDCYCPKYGYFEQKVIVGRTLIFFDTETLTYTKSRQRNAFNHFWDVSEKPCIPFEDRVKEKEASESNDKVAHGQSTKWKPETSGQNENNVKVKNEYGQNPKSKPEKSVAAEENSYDALAETCATTQNDDQSVAPVAYATTQNDGKHQNKAVSHSEVKIKDEPMPNRIIYDKRYFRMIQPYSACCARAMDLIKHMRLPMSNREDIVGNNIVRGKPEVFISSYIVIADLPFWLPMVDIYAEKTEIESERNGVIQLYSACCARATDLIKHIWLSMRNREGIVGNNIHVVKSDNDSERNVNTATFQYGDFENAHNNYELPMYGNKSCILDNDATFENECQLKEFTVDTEKLEKDYNDDLATGILGIYARGQEQVNIEKKLTNNGHDDNDDDEDGHDLMSGLFGVYARD